MWAAPTPRKYYHEETHAFYDFKGVKAKGLPAADKKWSPEKT